MHIFYFSICFIFQMLLTTKEVENNPWNIQSIYDLQYFNCASCIYKIKSKKEFVSHVYDFHPEVEEYLRNIQDGSINDIELPILEGTTTKIEFKTDLDLSYQSDNLDIKIEEFEDVKVEEHNFKIDDYSLSTAIVVADPEEVDSYYCNHCDTYFCNHDTINEHKRVVHEESDMKQDSGNDIEYVDQFYEDDEYSFNDVEKKYKCEQCDKIFNSQQSRRRHVRHIHEGLEPKVTCTICGKKLHKRILKDHIKNVHGPKDLQCPHCEKKFNSQKNLKSHLVIHTGIKSYECSQCEKKFYTLSHLNAHIKKIHDSENRNEKYQCDRCENIYSGPYAQNSLRAHIKSVHEGEEKVKCPLCGKMVCKSLLEDHTKRKHNSDHQCDKCEMTFNTVKRLERHIKHVHDKIKEFICDTCGKAFQSRGNLTLHIRIHTDEKQHECHLCGKKFLRPHHLLGHVEKTHNGLRQFPCPHCDKKYKNSSSLNQHVEIIHLGIKKHMCDLCSKTFGQRVELTMHYARHHKDTYLKNQVQQPSNSKYE